MRIELTKPERRSIADKAFTVTGGRRQWMIEHPGTEFKINGHLVGKVDDSGYIHIPETVMVFPGDVITWEEGETGHKPPNTLTQDVKIEAIPASSQKTPITQTAEELKTTIEFAYKLSLRQDLVITSPTKLSLEQMQELQKKFEDQGYQVTELKYEGVVES